MALPATCWRESILNRGYLGLEHIIFKMVSNVDVIHNRRCSMYQSLPLVDYKNRAKPRSSTSTSIHRIASYGSSVAVDRRRLVLLEI